MAAGLKPGSLFTCKRTAESKKTSRKTARTPRSNCYSPTASSTFKQAICQYRNQVLQQSLHLWHCSNHPGVIFKRQHFTWGRGGGKKGSKIEELASPRKGAGMKTKPHTLGGVRQLHSTILPRGTRPSPSTSANKKGIGDDCSLELRQKAHPSGRGEKTAQSPCKRKAFFLQAEPSFCSARGFQIHHGQTGCSVPGFPKCPERLSACAENTKAAITLKAQLLINT